MSTLYLIYLFLYFRRLIVVEVMPMENQPWSMQLRAYLMQQLLQLGIEEAQLKWFGHLGQTTGVHQNQNISSGRKIKICSILLQEVMPTVSARSLLEASLRSLNNASEMGTFHSLEMTHG